VSSAIAAMASVRVAASPVEEVQRQNAELLETLERLRRREEELRQQTQELEDTNRGVMALYAELDDRASSLRSADQLKSRFLSHVSHEFRTPLNSIVALAGLLKSRVDGDLSAEQERQIDYIVKAAEELREMVNDLLDLAKVESGKITIHESEVTIRSLFGALRGLMKPLWNNEAVDLVFEEPPFGLSLHTDETKVSQILRNLVSNALKFTEQGEVRISTSITTQSVIFRVSDTGIGIRSEDQELIFQEFAQVQHSIQKRVRGTGLGLPLSRKLAELLGGTLTVVSSPGQGSVFTFTLPASVLAVSRQNSQQEGHIPVATLLVIDDDEVTRYVVRQMLRDTPISVVEADSGSTGLERARFERPDAILLDVTMPDMSGFEVLEILRQTPETQEIPVTIYTSRDLPKSDRDRLAEMGCPILSKRDLDEKEFIAALRSNLRSSAPT
jgi:signal transduction histidine kinase